MSRWANAPLRFLCRGGSTVRDAAAAAADGTPPLCHDTADPPSEQTSPVFAHRRVQPFKGTLRDGDAPATAPSWWRRPKPPSPPISGYILSHRPGILLNAQFSAPSSLQQEIHKDACRTLKVQPLARKSKSKYPLRMMWQDKGVRGGTIQDWGVTADGGQDNRVHFYGPLRL